MARMTRNHDSGRDAPEGRRVTHVADLIHLDVPASPRSLAVLRTATAAAGVSLREDLTVDVVDDLRLAIDELAAAAVEGAAAGARLDVSIRLEDDFLTVRGRRTASGPMGDSTTLTDVSSLLLASVCRRYEVAPDGSFAVEFDLTG